jgi:TusA-related sulfurtransferase
MNSVLLDLCGEVCPSPRLHAQAALQQFGPDSRLVVETDLARCAQH